MAIEFISWALEQDLPTGQKFVLVALCNRADHNGECFPSQSDLAKQTGQNVRSVRRHIEWLCERGFIEKKQRRRKNGSYTSDYFTIHRTNLPQDKLTVGQKVQQPEDTVSYPEPSLNSSLRSELEPSIPAWLNLDAWQLYKDHRGKKFTARAQKLALGKLERWRAKGHDPTEILEASVMNGWTGIFEPRGKKDGKGKLADETAQLLAEIRTGGSYQDLIGVD